MPLMNQSEYARHRGISRQAVYQAVRAGRIVLLKGKIDSDAADAAWDSGPQMDRLQPGGEPPKGFNKEHISASLASSRALREAYAARLAKLDWEIRSGEMVSAEDARKAAFNTGRRARDLFMAMPDRLASSLEMRTSSEIHKILSEEVRHVCEEVSRWAKL